jgi:serine/threonine protein kinase
VTSPGYPRFDEPSCGRQLPLAAGEELAGKYRIERVVGSGAMGLVALAWHIELEQPVAIKFLHAELAADAVGAERFRREARAAARIESPHVARVLDVGALEESGIPFIVMEYLEGRDLARELVARGPLPVHETVAYVLEACEAVAEAHSHGVVHRDLKPANLFLARRTSGTRMVKVLDFGISKIGSASTGQLSITDTAMLMGSPAYMSPEQLESSRNVDSRSDIWSLGVILHELVAGALPFRGESVPQLVRAIVTGSRKPLTDLGAPAELEQVVVRCLQQDPARRFQSVAELCAVLHPIARSSVEALASGRTLLGHPGRGAEPVSAEPGASPRAGSNAGEGAWGRTHGGRRGTWQRHRLPVGVFLGLLAASIAWAARDNHGPIRMEKHDVPVASLRAEQALVRDVGSSEPPRVAPVPQAGATGTAEPPAAIAPGPAAAPAPLASAPVPSRRATPALQQPIETTAASGAGAASAMDAGATPANEPAAPALARDPGPAPGDALPAPPPSGRVEIPEFGGRE